MCKRGEIVNNYFRFFRQAFCLPPVARRLCIESREIPAQTHREQTPTHPPLASHKPNSPYLSGVGTRTSRTRSRRRGRRSYPWWRRWLGPATAAPLPPPPPGPPAPPLLWLGLAGKRRAKPWRDGLYSWQRPRVRVFSQVGLG
jgi:hypothetical protein